MDSKNNEFNPSYGILSPIEIKSEEINDTSSKIEKIKNLILNKKIYFIIGGILILIIIIIIFYNKGKSKKIKYEFGLDMKELEMRVSKEFLISKVLLKKDAPEYLNLEKGDKQALKHLVKAGAILENVNLQIDDHHNLPFKLFLEEEIKKKINKLF